MGLADQQRAQNGDTGTIRLNGGLAARQKIVLRRCRQRRTGIEQQVAVAPDKKETVQTGDADQRVSDTLRLRRVHLRQIRHLKTGLDRRHRGPHVFAKPVTLIVAIGWDQDHHLYQ